MPTLSFTPRDGDWEAYVDIPYTISYDRSTNKTTVRFNQAAVVYYGRQGYGTSMECSITVTATDSSDEQSSQLTTYGYTSGSTEARFTGTPSPNSIVVDHSGEGIKSIKIEASCAIHVYKYASSSYQSTVRGNGSETTTVGSRFVLSVSQGTGSTISVKRNGTALQDGALISTDERLVVEFEAALGYFLTKHTVNDIEFVSGSTHSVSSNVHVVSTASVFSYALSVAQGNNTNVSVNRLESPYGGGSIGQLSSGATIYYNDVLKITFGVATGCVLTTHTVNGASFTSGNNHTVTAAVSVVSAATVNSYALSMSSSGRITLAINRTSSPLQGAAQGYLSNGATIYYGDVLSMTFEVSTGSTISVHTINGVSFNSGYAHTVTSAVAVIVSATLNEYQITRAVGVGVSLVIKRTASPYGRGTIGILTGNTVYYGDELQLTVQASSGYAIDSMKINQVPYYDNPHTITVVNTLLITILAAALGFVHIDSGAAIEKYKILIDSGSAYEQYRAMIDTGSEIVPY